VTAPHRDKIMLQKAPFDSPAVEVTRTEQRYAGILWSDQPSIALLTEYDLNRHWRRTFIVDLDDLKQQPRLLWDLSTDESYADPGDPVRHRLANGFRVIRQDGDSIYLEGEGSSPDGDRPFLDRLDLKTLKTERLFRSDKSSDEEFLSLRAGRADISDLASIADRPAECVFTNAWKAASRAPGRSGLCFDERGDHPHSRSHAGGASDQEAAGEVQARRRA
jgi:dipeptidyl aminopeptidase/acylaminoacyl peptidase